MKAFTSLLALSAGAAAYDQSCQTILESLAGHTDVEVAALCRARLPPSICGAARSILGERTSGRTSWAPEKVNLACSHWEAASARMLGTPAKATTKAPPAKPNTAGKKEKDPASEPLDKAVEDKDQRDALVAATFTGKLDGVAVAKCEGNPWSPIWNGTVKENPWNELCVVDIMTMANESTKLAKFVTSHPDTLYGVLAIAINLSNTTHFHRDFMNNSDVQSGVKSAIDAAANAEPKGSKHTPVDPKSISIDTVGITFGDLNIFYNIKGLTHKEIQELVVVMESKEGLQAANKVMAATEAKLPPPPMHFKITAFDAFNASEIEHLAKEEKEEHKKEAKKPSSSAKPANHHQQKYLKWTNPVQQSERSVGRMMGAAVAVAGLAAAAAVVLTRRLRAVHGPEENPLVVPLD